MAARSRRAGIPWPGSAVAAVLLLACGLAVSACGPTAVASFDPATPCGGAAQQQMPGAYPALEARVPQAIDGQAAATRESGRFCTRETLGSLFDAGVTEERFGGAIWEVGDRGGLQLTVFEGAGLTPALVAEEYRRSADASRGTEAVRPTTLEVDGRPAWRIDVVNGSSRQAVVVWGSADGAVVQVVIAADIEEAQLQAAIAAFR